MGRHGNIAALNIEDELLRWTWAVQEQARLWQVNDHDWHVQAQNGWPGDSGIYEMLSSYGLLRGKRGSILAGDKSCARKRFAAMAVRHAKDLENNNPDANTKVWQSFNHAFFTYCREEDLWPADQKTSYWFMPSATLKVMWFSAPDKIPMYDRYAVRGLKQLARHRSAPSPEEFLKEVASLMKKSADAITKAKEIWDCQYPYDIRIVDKYLWLKGSGRERQILSRFHAACGSLIS